jgi:hypothetical protein
METLDEITPDAKQRHGCVTAWLIVVIIINAIAGGLAVFASDLIIEGLGGYVPAYLVYLSGACSIANVIFAILLFQWRKIGFWGFICTSLINFTINLNIGFGIYQSLIGLVGIAVLYMNLHIKKKNSSTWERLE